MKFVLRFSKIFKSGGFLRLGEHFGDIQDFRFKIIGGFNIFYDLLQGPRESWKDVPDVPLVSIRAA